MATASGILVACAGFLLAVLWMDLMFDVQAFGAGGRDADLPEPVLASIASYYRRVTTTAAPMTYLIGAVMLLLLATLARVIVAGPAPRWAGLLSLPFGFGPVLLALLRVFPNAIRLGTRSGSAAAQSALARSIGRDHLLCFGAMLTFTVIHLLAAA